MRRLILLILCISCLLALPSCEWDPISDPTSEKMTKWQSDKFELYVSDSIDSIMLVYNSRDRVMLFNVRLCQASLIICTRSENEDDDMQLVALYGRSIPHSEKYYTYNLHEIACYEYADIFPKKFRFKCVDAELSEEEVPYEWQTITSEQAIKLKADYYNSDYHKEKLQNNLPN